MVRTKVFVGNLSFKTRESELAQEFAAAGHVIGANIITRGPRSLGYGFVEFDSEEEANNAVKIMSKKEIDGRAINVEVAKPREEIASGQQQTNGAPTTNNTNANSNNTNANTGSPRGGFRGRGRGGFRGGFRGRGRGGFRGRGGRGGFRRRFNENNTNTGENQAVEGGNTGSPQQGGAGGRRRFNKRENQGPDTRTESKTTLFVANLPFSLDDAGFNKVFADNGLKVKSVHVVQKRNGRSKGFGFAEFDTQDDQQKALQALNNKKVEERELIVKVALTEQEGASNPNNNNTNTNTNTNASSSPAPTPNNTNVKKEEPAKKEEVKKEEKK
jgi:RNA recognition motif-containing protein